MRKYARFFGISYVLVLVTLLVIPTKGSGLNLGFYLFGIRTDHLIHALLFVPFMVFYQLIFREKPLIIGIFFGIFFASFCESLHYFLPYREFSMEDFYANAAGIIVGSLSYFIFSTRLKFRG